MDKSFKPLQAGLSSQNYIPGGYGLFCSGRSKANMIRTMDAGHFFRLRYKAAFPQKNGR
jgi:hypothetical protein